MITDEFAKAFAAAWINAWNNHNLEHILEHYENDVAFYSPLIRLLNFNNEGAIKNKADLKKYFETGLKNYPDLHFKLHHCFAGVHSIVIYYSSVNEQLCAEVFELSENGKAKRVLCNYAQ